jgi:hypothetical protein
MLDKVQAFSKPLKLYDGGGLYLLVRPNGSRWWRFKYRYGGKEKLLSMGVYPDVSLEQARARRDAARLQLIRGTDPAAHRKAQKLAGAVHAADTFEAVAREWVAKCSPAWLDSHSAKIIRGLEQHVFPWIGERPVADITTPEILAVMRRIEDRGTSETARRVLRNCAKVFRHAIACGQAARDPTEALR